MLVLVGLAALAGPMPAFAAAFVGWNPMLALDFAGGGHNDVWMVAFVLGALALASRRRPALAGTSWAIAVGVKWVPLVLLPLSLDRSSRAQRTAHRRRLPGHVGRRRRCRLPCLRNSLGDCAGAADPAPGSLLSLPSRLVELGLPRPLADLSAAAPLLVALPWLVRDARAGRPRLGLATGLLVVASPWVLPWYAVWIVPFAAIEEDRLAWVLALVLSAYLLPDRVPL